ncbi:MAG TPA: murein biosynthesis integral membrane protein MurJ [Pyrinomonadaceae bacterium]|nr:murein biosynthesis integral membrane protein MurJ [Pyrinomonadaceae bacterium]
MPFTRNGLVAALNHKITLQRSISNWKVWRESSVNCRIFASMLIVGGLGLAVTIFSALKEIVIAHQFGAGDNLDAFLIAYLVPAFAINVVARSFNAALIPTYTEVREQEGKEAAQRLFSSCIVWSSGLLIAFSILLAAASPYILPILGSGFNREKLALTHKLFLIVLPTLPLTGMFLTWSAVLNARERFALAAFAPVLTPIVVISLVLILGEKWGVYAFAVALVIGAALESSVMIIALMKEGISPVPRWHGMSPSLRQVRNQYMPMVAGGLMMGSTGLVDKSLAAMLKPGSVSVLNYGSKITAVFVSIVAMAVSTAVLPQFSRMVVAGLWTNLGCTIKTYTRLIFSITIPLTFILILLSNSLVRLLFQKGAFTASDTLQVALVQNLYILQLPFYVCGMLYVRLISAFKANHILMWGTAISFVLNIGLDWLFMKWLGVPGIALSTSMVYLVSFCYLWRMSLQLLRGNALNSSSAQVIGK